MERVSVSIYLVNGIKLQGQIESFDQFVIFARRKNTVSQMVLQACYHLLGCRGPVAPAGSGSAERSRRWKHLIVGRSDCFSSGH